MLIQDKEKLFFDANVFIAVANKKDRDFKKALKVIQLARRQKKRIYSLDLVVYEVLTVLSLRLNKKSSLDFGQEIFKKKSVILIEKNQRLQKFAWQIFQKVKSKNFSFVDAFILAVLKQDPALVLASFDKQLLAEAKKLKLKTLNG